MTRPFPVGQDVGTMVPQPSLFEIASSSGASRHPARGDQILIGRSPENDIVLSNEPTVSRRHAELVHDGEVWAVRDVGSHNGTYVNGVRLAADQIHPITAADVVGVGNVTVRLLPGVEVDGMTVEDSSGLDAHRLLTALSQREREVLERVAAGRTDEQVATELFISVKTVHSHLDRIRDKTGLRRRAELTRLAVRLGLGGGTSAG